MVIVLNLTNPNDWLIDDFVYESIEDELDYYKAISMCRHEYQTHGFVYGTKVC